MNEVLVEVEEVSVGYENIYKAMQAGEIRPLADLHDVEATLELIRQIDKKVDFLKELKKKRVSQIEQEVSKLSERQEFLKEIVIKTLQASKEKSVKFPGIGSASQRSSKGKWEIVDEETLIETLKKEGEDDLVTYTPKINKKELNKLLDQWKLIDKLPGGVKYVEGEVGLTLKFDKDGEASDDLPSVDSLPVPKKPQAEESVSEEDFDQLDFTK